MPREERLGYVISQDQYFKRDDVGIIYQLNVVPAKQRALIGATLIKAVFDRAAYGCKLFCCWCAQDIQANHFWESLGFIPLAFRSGSRGKQRTHVFWQRRIRQGDVVTPYWFPSQTSAGSIREDRLVLPIPPGTSWRDVLPMVLPQGRQALEEKNDTRETATPKPRKKKVAALPANSIAAGGMRFVNPEEAGAKEKPKAPRVKQPKLKNDPMHVAAARELRDRYLEQFNSGLVLPQGKYEVSRTLEMRSPTAEPKLLPQAA